MRKTLLSFILIFMCLALMPQSPERYQWFSAGVGSYGFHNSAGFGLGASYDLKKVHHFKIRLITVGEFTLMSSKDPDAYTEAGILYSHVFGKKWFRVTASGGLGFLAGRKIRQDYNMTSWDSVKEEVFAPAMPLELGMDFVSRRAGIGMAGFANINSKASIRGLIFRVSFGKMR